MDERAKKGRVSRREWLWCLAFVAAAALALGLAGRALKPAHRDYGSTWGAYLAEPKNSIDVLFLGSSMAYCDWNPGIVFDESGLTGYVMGGSEQTFGLTYYYLKEALRTQTPSVVVLEGSALFFDRYKNYTQLNVGYMPWGLNRLGAALEYGEEEKRTALLLDLYAYHDRWKEATPGGILQSLAPAKADHLKGFTAVDGTFEQGERYVFGMSQSEEVYQANLKDLARIGALCEEKGLELIVTANPTYGLYVDEVYERMERDALAAGAGRFLNWSDVYGQAGMDMEAHLFDGSHLNQEGAAAFSRFTGRYLRSLGYEPRPQSEENAARWRETAEYWTAQ